MDGSVQISLYPKFLPAKSSWRLHGSRRVRSGIKYAVSRKFLERCANEIQAVEKLAGTPSLRALTLYRPTRNQRRGSNATPPLQNLVEEDLYPRCNRG